MTTHTDLIARLRDDLAGGPNAWLKREAAAALESLEQQVAALRVDAERYRWLRDGESFSHGIFIYLYVPDLDTNIREYAPHETDAAIDAAMKESDMNKLTALIEAAKAATSQYADDWKLKQALLRFDRTANPATILELCTLLEQAEDTLKAQVEDKRDGPFFHEDEHLKGSCLRNSEEALAAIKQWKKQT